MSTANPGKDSFYTGAPLDGELPRSTFVKLEHGHHPHVDRARAILKAHPEIKELFGYDVKSAYWGTALVTAELVLAVLIAKASLPWILLTSYLVGAVIHHALWVLIHESTHHLVFSKRKHNKLFAIFLNLPQVVPSAISFGKYHGLHHSYQGDYDHDADLVPRKLGTLISNSKARKFLYMLFFSFAQGAIHPTRITKVRFWDPWTVLNWVVQFSFLVVFYKAFGFRPLLYLTLSTFFALGLHPMGGRWIAEHYLVEEHQETNSYYGPLNKVSFNMGYHNEHHDFCRIPWTRLPEVKRTAPEYYDGLFSYKSWAYALWRFITDDRVTPFDRVDRSKPQPDSPDPS